MYNIKTFVFGIYLFDKYLNFRQTIYICIFRYSDYYSYTSCLCFKESTAEAPV